MEVISVTMDEAKFDACVHGDAVMKSLPGWDNGCIEIHLKRHITQGGKPGAVIAFPVVVPGGKVYRAQWTVTMGMLDAAFAIIKGWRDGGHFPKAE